MYSLSLCTVRWESLFISFHTVLHCVLMRNGLKYVCFNWENLVFFRIRNRLFFPIVLAPPKYPVPRQIDDLRIMDLGRVAWLKSPLKAASSIQWRRNERKRNQNASALCWSVSVCVPVSWGDPFSGALHCRLFFLVCLILACAFGGSGRESWICLTLFHSFKFSLSTWRSM